VCKIQAGNSTALGANLVVIAMRMMLRFTLASGCPFHVQVDTFFLEVLLETNLKSRTARAMRL